MVISVFQKNYDDLCRNRDKVQQSKLSRAEKDVEAYRKEYENINESVMRNLTALNDGCEPYVRVSFEAFALSQQILFNASKSCYDDILQEVDHSTSENDLMNRLEATRRELTSLSIVAK